MPKIASKVVAQRVRDGERAREFWGSLTTQQRWDLGDALVLEGGRGYLVECYEFRREALTSAFMDELDRQRILWECMGAGEYVREG